MSSSTKEPPRLILLSGLGADERLLAPQQTLKARVEMPAWPAPEPGEPLSRYAGRIADQIEPGDELFIGGVSFGGFVALEIARRIQVRGVVLLASGRSFHCVPPALQLLARGARFVPSWVVKLGGRIPGVARHLFGARSEQDVQLFNELLADVSVPYLRWAAGALLDWQSPPLTVPILQIHGDRDRIIPLRRVRPEHVISGAGHLMNVTHAEAVNSLVDRWISAPRSPGESAPAPIMDR